MPPPKRTFDFGLIADLRPGSKGRASDFKFDPDSRANFNGIRDASKLYRDLLGDFDQKSERSDVSASALSQALLSSSSSQHAGFDEGIMRHSYNCSNRSKN